MSSDIPNNLSLNLEGMELLTIQYLLDGKNTEYGYKFRLIGLDKASFSGSRDEEMLDTRLVQRAEEAGALRKVKFYIEHKESPEKSRAIKLNFYEDGHVTSRGEVTSNEFNKIVEAISATREHSEYLTSLDDLIGDYITEIELEGERGRHRNRVNHAFSDLVESELHVSTDSVVDNYIHKMIVANVGLALYEKSQSESGLDFDASLVPTDWDPYVSKFFEYYTQYEMDNIEEEAHNYVVSSINELIEDVQPTADDYDAMTLLEKAIERHDL